MILRLLDIPYAINAEEAMSMAGQTSFDIAVLDYYLKETTGDALCRELIASESTGDIMCTVLTGTYSDHIIKRSLRAGAVECMFKNESSDMLLSRIAAISRLVRQKRQLLTDGHLLETVLGHIAGPVILIDRDQRIAYINRPAVRELGISDIDKLRGQAATVLLGNEGPRPAGEKLHSATWQLPNEETVDVDYKHTRIEANGHSVLRFTQRVVSIDNADLVVLQQNKHPDALADNVIRQFSLFSDCKPFFLQTCRYLEDARQEQASSNADEQSASPMRVSLLIIDVFVSEANNTLQPIDTNKALAAQVRTALYGLAAREHHVAALAENRYGFLLRHAEEKQAFALTRKVMQRCLNETYADTVSAGSGKLACFGSLLNLSNNADQPVNVLVQHVFKGLEIIKGRNPNQAILLDVRRLLSAFPSNSVQDSVADS
jgi:DNA-binding response OmpR family regulator